MIAFDAELNAQNMESDDLIDIGYDINDLYKLVITVTMPTDVTDSNGNTDGKTVTFDIEDLTAENALHV